MEDDSRQREPARYSIGELAELGGVSRRTVRYYVQRGLLEAPTGLGRGRHYTRRHLDTLIRVRKLQEAGYGLAEIAGEAHQPASELQSARVPDPAPGPEEATPAPVPTPGRRSSWTRIEIADGVELHLRDTHLGARQVRSVGEAILEIMRQGGRR